MTIDELRAELEASRLPPTIIEHLLAHRIVDPAVFEQHKQYILETCPNWKFPHEWLIANGVLVTREEVVEE